MMNRTDLEVRLLNHAARIAHAHRFGALCDPPRSARRGPRRFAATLLRLTARPIPEQSRWAGTSDTATA